MTFEQSHQASGYFTLSEYSMEFTYPTFSKEAYRPGGSVTVPTDKPGETVKPPAPLEVTTAKIMVTTQPIKATTTVKTSDRPVSKGSTVATTVKSSNLTNTTTTTITTSVNENITTTNSSTVSTQDNQIESIKFGMPKEGIVVFVVAGSALLAVVIIVVIMIRRRNIYK